MRIALAVVVFLGASGLAHADDRSMFITVGGTAGAMGHSESNSGSYDMYPVADGGGAYTYQEPYSLVGPRITLSWEHAPLPLPAAPGYRFAGSIVPELLGGSFIEDVRAEGYVGAGVRAELKMAQREQGLLKISARGAMYLAGRGMVVGSDRDAILELGFGEYLGGFSKWTRVGFEFDVITRDRKNDTMEATSGREVGGLFQFYIGFAP